MKKLFFFIGIILFFVTQSWATVLVSEGWETGTPNADWPCKNIPGACSSNPFDGWSGRGFDCNVTGGQESTLSTTQAHSGTKSYYQYRASGASYACDISKSYTDQTKIYISFWLYFPSAIWSSWTTNPLEANDDAGHFFFVRTGLRAANRIVVDINDTGPGPWPGRCWGSGGDHAYFSFMYDGEDATFGADATYCWDIMANLDRWTKHTWMFDIPNQKFAQWIDGTQVVGTGGNGVTQTFGELANLTPFIFSAYRSSNTGVVQGYYLDDIIIATSLSDVEGATDETPPTLSNLTPAGSVSYTSTKTLSVTTNEDSSCRFHATESTWANLTPMSSTGGTTHTQSVNTSASTAYTFNALCQDVVGNQSNAGQWSFTTQATPAPNTSVTIGIGGGLGLGSGGSLILSP